MHSILDFLSLHSIRGVQHLALILLAVGLVGCIIAAQRAGNNNPQAGRAQVWGALFAGILTGAGVTVGVLVLQQWLADANANALWRANVQTAASIPGFTADNHTLQGLNLSGKQLQDAELRGANLKRVELRDTNLTGADLEYAHFNGDVMYSANLSNTNLTGADLSGAQLQGAQFKHADIYSVKSLRGAIANAATCWPSGFFKFPKAKQVKATDYHDALGNVIVSRGHEYPNCLKTG
jgi:Pentapeptide repeats (8 copies)